MSGDLIAVGVAIMLGVVVVGMGLQRNLADTTRRWLPRPGEASEREVATSRSPRWRAKATFANPTAETVAGGGSLLLGLAYAAMAVLWADDKLIHAVFAALWAMVAAGYLRGRLPLLMKVGARRI